MSKLEASKPPYMRLASVVSWCHSQSNDTNDVVFGFWPEATVMSNSLGLKAVGHLI